MIGKIGKVEKVEMIGKVVVPEADPSFGGGLLGLVR